MITYSNINSCLPWFLFDVGGLGLSVSHFEGDRHRCSRQTSSCALSMIILHKTVKNWNVPKITIKYAFYLQTALITELMEKKKKHFAKIVVSYSSLLLESPATPVGSSCILNMLVG